MSDFRAAGTDTSTAAVMCVDLQGRLTVWGSGAEQLYGYAGADVLGESLALLDPVPGGPDPSPEVLRALHGEPVEPFESVRRRRDGTVVPVEVTLTPVVGDHGEVVAAAAVHRDLSSSGGAARLLAFDRATMDSVLDPHIVLAPVLGPDGQVVDLEVVDANELACRDLGREREELVGELLSGTGPGRGADGLVGRCAELVETGEPLVLDGALLPDADGSGLRWCDIRGVRAGGTVLLSWRDSTALHHAVAQLTERERRYRAIAEHSSDVVLEVAGDGTVEWVSASVVGVLGWAPDELVGRSVDVLVVPEDVAGVRSALIAGGPATVTTDNLRCCRRDGTRVWMSCRMTPEDGAPQDGAAGPTRWVVALRDVDQQVLAAAELAESEAQLHSLLDGTNATLSRWTTDRRMTVSSRAVGRAEGQDVGSLIGRTAEEMGYTEAELRRWNTAFDEVLATQEPVSYDARLDLPSGPVWWSCELTPELDTSGSVVGVLSLLTDVSERGRAMEELEALTEQYRLLAENASDVVVRASATGVVEWISPSVTDLSGWGVDELVGVDFIDLVDPRDHPRVRATRSALAEGGPQRLEFRLRCRDGSSRWCEAAVRPVIDERGRIVGRIGSWRDVEAEHAARLRLEESELRFRQVVTHTPVGVALADADGRLVQVNPAMCAVFGREEQDLLARTWQELTHPDDLEVDLSLVAELLDGRRDSYRLVKRYLRPGGEIVWGDLSAAVVRDDSGGVQYLLGQVLDVTERVQAEHLLAGSEALLRTVVESTEDSILRIGRDHRVDMVNQRVVERSGRPASEWVGRRLSEVGDSFGPASEHQERIDEVLRTGRTARYEFEAEVEGERRWFLAVASPARADGEQVSSVVVSARDVTDRVRAEEELIHLATRDALTGLASRSELLPEITRALGSGVRAGRYTAVLLLDLDRFKVVNDSLGHDVGDQVLDAAARRLEATVRDADLVVRAGGDEFVVVMRDIEDPADVVRAAWRIVEAFRDPFTVAGADLYSTASIGVSISAGHAEPGDMVREGDTAMYVAKRAGGDRVAVFNEELRDAADARLAVETDLRPALARDELAVWFQPEVDLATGEVVAAEALLRWRHPDGEIWTADRFITVAEEAGLMIDIGAWVLVTACEAASTWRTRHPGRDLTIRVNLSALQLVDDDLLDVVDEALERTGVPPSSLCVEITETALLRANQVMRDNFAGLHGRGIQIASDDFGTGYASLAYLHDYPIDVVKIDRSFIIDLTSDESDARLVAGTIALAGHLDMSVTAEGVETPQQAALLRSLGCPSAQGFLFSPAIPGEDFERLLDHTFPTG